MKLCLHIWAQLLAFAAARVIQTDRAELLPSVTAPAAHVPAVVRAVDPAGVERWGGGRRTRSPRMGKKPFKGGNLDDFVSAAEAEARYGPQRYAAVYEDLTKIQVETQTKEREAKFSERVYEALKRQLVVDDAVLSAFGCALVAAFADMTSARSFAVGAALGGFYLFLSQRSADNFGASRIEDIKPGPPALVAPVLMVLIATKSPLVSTLPTFVGYFTTERAAVLASAFYPQDMGLDEDGDEDLGFPRPFWFLYDRGAERPAKPRVDLDASSLATREPDAGSKVAERTPSRAGRITPAGTIQGEKVLSSEVVAALARKQELRQRLDDLEE